MTCLKILVIGALAFVAVNPFGASAQNRPLVLITSDSKQPPLAGNDRTAIGYWDADDHFGNRGGFSKKLKNIFSGFDGDIHYGSKGTCTERSGLGHYMATLAINPRTINQIMDLSLITDLNSSILESFAPNVYENCKIMENNSRNNYLVGWWDVDGGGGQGSDGKNVDRVMALTAKFGSSPSDRKLLDLQLVASNRKGPTPKSGYQIVGFWDVDKGGARGTDGSTGSYMMTLLAKWDK